MSDDERAAVAAFLKKTKPTKLPDGSAMEVVERSKRYRQAIGEFIGGPPLTRGSGNKMSKQRQEIRSYERKANVAQHIVNKKVIYDASKE